MLNSDKQRFEVSLFAATMFPTVIDSPCIRLPVVNWVVGIVPNPFNGLPSNAKLFHGLFDMTVVQFSTNAEGEHEEQHFLSFAGLQDSALFWLGGLQALNIHTFANQQCRMNYMWV
ncbi:hypothetical protein AeMF1_011274 [Aphanomyces euteiches]|nr:hypothetical protein AeMF1_011274 [Aphanomyces euteiches]